MREFFQAEGAMRSEECGMKELKGESSKEKAEGQKQSFSCFYCFRALRLRLEKRRDSCFIF
jgi:hypothetical protein